MTSAVGERGGKAYGRLARTDNTVDERGPLYVSRLRILDWRFIIVAPSRLRCRSASLNKSRELNKWTKIGDDFTALAVRDATTETARDAAFTVTAVNNLNDATSVRILLSARFAVRNDPCRIHGSHRQRYIVFLQVCDAGLFRLVRYSRAAPRPELIDCFLATVLRISPACEAITV
jgi:hypothetical protein